MKIEEAEQRLLTIQGVTSVARLPAEAIVEVRVLDYMTCQLVRMMASHWLPWPYEIRTIIVR